MKSVETVNRASAVKRSKGLVVRLSRIKCRAGFPPEYARRITGDGLKTTRHGALIKPLSRLLVFPCTRCIALSSSTRAALTHIFVVFSLSEKTGVLSHASVKFHSRRGARDSGSNLGRLNPIVPSGRCLISLPVCFVFQQRERVASVVHRQETVDCLKKFNARRKLKVSPPRRVFFLFFSVFFFFLPARFALRRATSSRAYRPL